MLRIVHTGCGAIEGIAAPEPEITVFRGIPFAAPPVGDLRWRAPQPVAAWAGTLAAHDFAPACPQPTPGDSNEFYDREWGTDPAIALDEDCLYLNVWTPRCAAATRTHTGERIARCRNGHGTPRSAATPCGWVSGPV